VELAQAAKDSQRNTMHNTLLYTITINTVHGQTLQLHKRNNRQSNQMTYLRIITLAPLPIPQARS